MRVSRAVLFMLLLTLLLSGCEAIGTIFKGGVWVGVVGAVIIIALLGLLVSVFRR